MRANTHKARRGRARQVEGDGVLETVRSGSGWDKRGGDESVHTFFSFHTDLHGRLNIL